MKKLMHLKKTASLYTGYLSEEYLSAMIDVIDAAIEIRQLWNEDMFCICDEPELQMRFYQAVRKLEELEDET